MEIEQVRKFLEAQASLNAYFTDAMQGRNRRKRFYGVGIVTAYGSIFNIRMGAKYAEMRNMYPPSCRMRFMEVVEEPIVEKVGDDEYIVCWTAKELQTGLRIAQSASTAAMPYNAPHIYNMDAEKVRSDLKYVRKIRKEKEKARK